MELRDNESYPLTGGGLDLSSMNIKNADTTVTPENQ